MKKLLLFLTAICMPLWAQTPYVYLPTADVTDSKMFTIVHDGSHSIYGYVFEFTLRVPHYDAQVEIGIFDGDNAQNWEGNTHPTIFTLYADPRQDGTGTTQIGQWHGSTMPDNDWYVIRMDQPPVARCLEGYYAYRLTAVSSHPYTIKASSHFKIRARGALQVDPRLLGFKGAQSNTSIDITYPNYPALTPTTYDGDWSWYFYVPKPPKYIEIWDGDFDYDGAYENKPSDTDDPNTPNDRLPEFAENTVSVLEGVAVGSPGSTGNPQDDSPQAWARRSPSITYELIAPDGQVFVNNNPSGSQEFERFRIDTAPFDPTVMDYSTDYLPAGVYRIHIWGQDFANACFLHMGYQFYGVNEGGQAIIDPYPSAELCTIGDYIWHDRNRDGLQDSEEPPLANVILRLINDMGYQIAKTKTDDNGWYLFKNIPAGSYAIEVDYSSVPPGFVLTTLHSPFQVTVQKTDRFVDADFGFATGYGTGGCREVFAWYEPWYASASSDSVLRHWDPSNHGGIADSALFTIYSTGLGDITLFDSRDPAIWAYDILMAWSADIDAFVVDWHGQNAFEQAATIGLLNTAQHLREKFIDQGFDFRIIIAYDEEAHGTLDDNLRFIADSLLIHPAYYHGREGLAAGSWNDYPRPLFVFSPSKSLNPVVFRGAADALLPDDVQVVWNWDGVQTDLKDHVDSVYPWVQATDGLWDDLNGLEWGQSYLDHFYTSAAELGVQFITGALWPGFDDRIWINGLGHWMDRRNGKTCQQTWSIAHFHQPRWIMIESWNDFNRGTAVYASRFHKDMYLKQTRAEAATWKNGQPCARLLPDEAFKVAEAVLWAYKFPLPGEMIEAALYEFFNRNYTMALSMLSVADTSGGHLQAPANTGMELAFVKGSASHASEGWEKAVDGNTEGWDGTATVRGEGPDYTQPPWAIFRFRDAGIHPFNLILLQNDNGAEDNEYSGRQAAVVEVLVSNTGMHAESFTPVWRGRLRQSAQMERYLLNETALARYVKLVIHEPSWTSQGWRQIVEFALGIRPSSAGEEADGCVMEIATPASFRLEQNHPNPFNPETTIRYQIPEACRVSLKIYDLHGREVAGLADGLHNPGRYSVLWRAENLASGVYFCRLHAGAYTDSKRLVLLR